MLSYIKAKNNFSLKEPTFKELIELKGSSLEFDKSVTTPLVALGVSLDTDRVYVTKAKLDQDIVVVPGSGSMFNVDCSDVGSQIGQLTQFACNGDLALVKSSSGIVRVCQRIISKGSVSNYLKSLFRYDTVWVVI